MIANQSHFFQAGKIAEHLDELGPGIMDQLTQAKLKEIERLRAAIQKQIEEEGGAHNVQMPEHLDAANWEKFGKDDLKKLIQKVRDYFPLISLNHSNLLPYTFIAISLASPNLAR